MVARTIDNLGVDISTRYAQDQATLDESFLKEGRGLPDQIKISVTTPSYASEFDLLFDLGKRGAKWAAFTPPTNYHASRRRLFAEQLIPHLGSPEMQETQIQRLRSFQSDQSEAATEKEKLLSLLENVHTLDQLLIDINSRRSQYQKG
jgi:hypothetical protein